MKKIASHKYNRYNKYKEYLSTKEHISNVKVLENRDVTFDMTIKADNYSFMFTFHSENKMPFVFLCNPADGKTKMPHGLYLQKSDLLYLCLSVKDDVSVKNFDYKGVIDYTLSRIIKLLTMSKCEEAREYRKEFLYFWNNASDNKDKIKLFIETADEIKKLNIYEEHKNNKLIACDVDNKLNKWYLNNYDQKNIECIYVPLTNTHNVLPPLKGNHWTVDTLRNLLSKCVKESLVDELEKISINSKEVILVFEMKLPDVLPITFLLKVIFNSKKRGSIFDKLNYVNSLKHLISQRCDKSFLIKRIGMYENDTKKILIVGLGSLGSYIAFELPKLGYDNLTLYDYDDYSVENIMRHRLGLIFAESTKAFATKFELSNNYPESNIVEYSKSFNESKLSEYNLEQFDLIIVTTGGTDYMLSLNKNFKSMNLSVPVLFSWIEPNGVAVHSLLVDYQKKGCYKCLYTNNEKNKAHLSHEKQKSVLKSTGCGGVFNSYGNLTLLKGTSLVLEIIQRHFEGQDTHDINPLYSIKAQIFGNDSKLIKRDLIENPGFYIDEGCDICGE